MTRARNLGSWGWMGVGALCLLAWGCDLRAQGAAQPVCPLLNTREVVFAWTASPGAGAAESVTVYQTRDGQIWQKVLTQPAGQREIVVTVLEDGWYGFSVAATPAAGEGEPPPGPGDFPEIQAIIDTRGPDIAFLEPEAGSAWDAGRPLPICWRAQDATGLREVLIEYRQEGAESWRLIRREERAAGEWAWVVPDLLRRHFEVRLSAVDLAGNRSASVERAYRLRTPPSVVGVTLRGPAMTYERDIALSIDLETEAWGEISHVELWETVDNGKIWRRRSETFTKDRVALTLRLSETGRYGFFVRPVPVGEVEGMAALEPGVLPQLECWAKFAPPEVKIERQDPPSTAAREKARRLYLAAQASLARRDADEAAKSLAECLKIWPDFMPAANDLACLHIRARRFPEAELLLARVVAIEPDDVDYRFNLGVALMSQGRHLEAVGHLERGAAATSTRRSESMLVLAECLRELGDVEKALAICRKIVEEGEPARIAAQAQRMLVALEGSLKR